MTRRERMENRLEKRREWADGRREKAAGLRKVDEHIRHDWAFITQPGHIPARARMNARDERAYEHGKVADHHERKADGLARVLDGPTIFSDDENAVEAITARVSELEAKRDAMKRGNTAYKRGASGGKHEGGALALRAEVGDALALEGLRTMQLCHWETRPFPPYALTNLGGNIRRLKARIEEIGRREKLTAEAEAAPGGVLVVAHDSGWVSVTFPEHPGRDIIGKLKAAGFRWSAPSWYGKGDALPEGIAP